MDSGLVGIVVAVIVVLVMSLIAFGMLAMFFAAPLLMKRRIEAWTAGMPPAQAYEAIAKGASRSFFQIRPASFLKEGQMSVPHPPHVIAGMIAHQFQSGWGRKLLAHDGSGVVVSRRWLPFLGTDMGWIGVLVAQPVGSGSVVYYRFRSTYMLPVITIFLQLYLQTGLIMPLKRALQAV